MSKSIDVGFWPVVPSNPTWLVGQADAVAKAKAEQHAALDAASDPDWITRHHDEYVAVVAYLSAPEEQSRDTRGNGSVCLVCGIALRFRTFFKGPFRYPENYLHYVEEHGIKPPQQLIEMARLAWVDPERNGSIKVGFWPEVPGSRSTPQELELLPEQAAARDRDIAEAEAARDAAVAAGADPAWHQDKPEEVTAVVAYLASPDRAVDYRGHTICRVCGVQNGYQDWYKGPFCYPQGYLHYILLHDHKPPQAVIDAALAAQGG